MLFNSIQFAIFLPIVFVLYRSLGPRGQNVLLLIGSYLFYGAWDPRFLTLIALSTAVDFTIGRALGRTGDEKKRKKLLGASIATNLGILGTFKYYGFFVGSAAGVLRGIGLDPNTSLLEVVLPVGISFYTFQTISYTFDVFRRRIEPTGDLVTFALYVSYFPQLVAGPIERAQRLLPQLERPRPRVDARRFRSGCFLILLGLFKKVAIADPVGQVVDSVFRSGGDANTATLFLGVFAFGIQVYGDFSGYSDIARGTSRLFGIELMRNFEQPYLARNITEFWRTWHISLSTWLWDYLYVPLGGNQRGRFATYRNLMLTMLLGGLWHGAAWTYVVWGGLHGAFLAIHRAAGSYVPRERPDPVSFRDAPRIVGTFMAISLLWPFFRGSSLQAAFEYLGGMFSFSAGLPNLDHLVIVVVAALLVLLIDVAQRNSGEHAIGLRWRPAFRGLAYASFFLAILVWSSGQSQPFIYFQF